MTNTRGTLGISSDSVWRSPLSNACHHLAALSLGANKSHLVAAQVSGIVSLPLISAKGRPSLRPPTP